MPSALNVDGLDSRRAKWGGAAKRYLRWAERSAPRLATAVVTDSRTVQELYRTEFGAETHYIPYGAELDDTTDSGADDVARLAEMGLEPRGYILFVGRLVPENNAHVLVDAYRRLQADARAREDLALVVVGDAPYADEYQAELKAAAGRNTAGASTAAAGASTAAAGAAPSGRVLFPGYVFGPGYRALARNAAVFVVPTEVGGTHPVLLEAMAAGNAVVVNDHAPNMEVAGDAAASYAGAQGAAGLAAVLRELLADPARMEDLRRRARERVRRLYSWDAVTDAYEGLARRLAEGR